MLIFFVCLFCFILFCSVFALACAQEDPGLLSLTLLVSFASGILISPHFLFHPDLRELVLMFEHLYRVRNGGFRNSEVKKWPDRAPPPYHSFTPAQKSFSLAVCSGER